MTWLRRTLRGAALWYLGVAVFERIAPRRAVRAYQRANNRVQGPLMGWLPGWALIETTGRKTGQPRQVPVGGRLSGRTFWCVAGDGRASSFVLNIEADPRVRVKIHGRWHTGAAHVVEDDDARRRLLLTNPVNGLFVALANPARTMLSVRIDLSA